MEQLQGIIYKATGGFYYVRCLQDASESAVLDLECRARGLFRKQGQKPLVGDQVLVQRDTEMTGTVYDILPRKNALIRPPLANLDYMVLVLSVTDPAPNLFVVDQYLAVLEHKGIEPLIVVTKSDLASSDALAALYRSAGFLVFVTDGTQGEGMSALTRQLAGKFSAFSGNSGVGKSSLLNILDARLELQTGDTSKKLGRGRHTTRHVEIHTLPNGARVADTPGFTSLEITVMSSITKTELAGCFREFAPHAAQCKFLDCVHMGEKGCAVAHAVEEGGIAASRYANYRQLYNEIKEVQPWQRR